LQNLASRRANAAPAARQRYLAFRGRVEALMDLGGTWTAAEANEEWRRGFPRPDFDDSDWQALTVPGQWQADPALATSDGPLLYRRRFSSEPLGEDERAWLVMQGVFYQSDVWLDGSYLGDTEGYFFPHSFDITEALKGREEHVLAIEVACERASKRTAKRNLIGVFGHWDCIDPSFNPGGIWAPVGVERSGPVRISSLRVTCPDANRERAVLDLRAVLDTPLATTVALRTEVSSHEGGTAVVVDQQQPLAAGHNRVRWQVTVPSPELWWPASLGNQPLYDLCVTVEAGLQRSDSRALRTGLRQVRMDDYVWRVNGEKIFLKGANLAPTRRDLAYASPEEVVRDVRLAWEAGLDLLRVHAHVGRPELYQAADQLGVLLWQDLPLQWGYKGVRHQAVRQAAAAVDLLGHHPSVITWCGHNEPFAFDPPAGGTIGVGAGASLLASQLLPTWNKTVLDHSIRRALERADRSRPVLAHSGILPHPAWGTDSHLYFGWYHGNMRGLPAALAAWPALGRFVSELGAQAVPYTAGFMSPQRWPELDWARLQAHHCLQKPLFDKFVPPSAYASFDSWRDATQAYQAQLVRLQVEALRRLKYAPTGGFAVFCFNDAQPAVSWSVLDHERVPKLAYRALTHACAPVLATAGPLLASYAPGDLVSIDVHVVNDLRQALSGATLEATLRWPDGGKTWRLEGDIPADSCVFVGNLTTTLPGPDGLSGPGSNGDGTSVDLHLELELRWGAGDGQQAQVARNSYTSMIRS
jgi:beta-mannosidase